MVQELSPVRVRLRRVCGTPGMWLGSRPHMLLDQQDSKRIRHEGRARGGAVNGSGRSRRRLLTLPLGSALALTTLDVVLGRPLYILIIYGHF